MAGTVILIIFWILSMLALLFFVAAPHITRSGGIASYWRQLWSSDRAEQVETSEATQQQEAQQGEQSAPNTEEFHFVVSKAQEEDIREAYLTEALRPFSKVLASTDIQHLSSSSSDDSSSDNSTQCRDPTSSSEFDIEQGQETLDDMQVDGDLSEFLGDSSLVVHLPPPGREVPSEENDIESQNHRSAPNGCPICLCTFQPDDRITWSSNPDCNHVFHHDCVLGWLKTRRLRKVRRRGSNDQTRISDSVDPLEWIIASSTMACPCCRRNFVCRSKDDKEESSTAKESSIDSEVEATVSPANEGSTAIMEVETPVQVTV